MASRNKKPKLCVITTVDSSLDVLFPDFYPLLLSKGYEVVGICANGAFVANLHKQGVRVIPVPITRTFTPIQDLKCLWMIYKIFRREQFDLIHYSTPKASVLAAIAGHLACCPNLLFTLRGLGYCAFSGWKRVVGKFCEKIACRWAHYVVVIGPSLKDKAVQEKLLPANRMNVLGMGSSKGVNLEQFQMNEQTIAQSKRIRQNLGINTDGVVIGYAGRLTPDKNIEGLLEAFCNIYSNNKNVYMLLVGTQDQRNPLSDKATAIIKAHPQIHTIPWQEEVSYCMGAMDILVLPSSSYREGFGNVLIEASAMEKAVITTSLSGARSAVLDGITGIIINSPDAMSIETALNRLIGNSVMRIEMGKSGRQWVTENFDRNIVWDRLIEVYERMLTNSHRPQN